MNTRDKCYMVFVVVMLIGMVVLPAPFGGVLLLVVLYVAVFWDEIYEGVTSWLRRNN